jgi:hypothetical protein
MTFSLNFTFDVDTGRRVIYTKIYGIWKKETAEEYHKAFIEAVKPLLKNKWAKLVNLTNWKPSYPEMIEVIGEHIRWSHENNAMYSIYVVDNPITKNQLTRMIVRSGYEHACKIFSNIPEAEQFLRENGF